MGPIFWFYMFCAKPVKAVIFFSFSLVPVHHQDLSVKILQRMRNEKRRYGVMDVIHRLTFSLKLENMFM